MLPDLDRGEMPRALQNLRERAHADGAAALPRRSFLKLAGGVRSVGSTQTAYVMETLLDEIARTTKQDPVVYRMRPLGSTHPRHRAALQLAVDRSGYLKKQLPAGRAWGVAVHESFDSVVAYVVEASVQAGVYCNLAVNPLSVEAQVQGAAPMGSSMCLPGAAITLKVGIVQQSNFGDDAVPRITAMPRIAVHIVPSAERPTGMGEPGITPSPPAGTR